MRIKVALLVLMLTGTLWAVKTSHWVHTSEADFKKGTFTHVVTTNLGDLKLSRQVKTVLGQDERVSAVFAMAQGPDGTIYAATGPEGILLSIKDDKVATAAELGAHTTLFSLLVDAKGRLLIGTGGEKGQILSMEKTGDKPQPIFSADDVQYVWAMTQTPDGVIYAATGPTGKLFQINPDGTNKVLLDSDENNLLCLVNDGKDFLYVGTDPNGLVYRVNRQTGEMYVLYDAPESEISALARDARGNLYAATAEAIDKGDEEAEGAGEQVGRPESELRGLPLPSQPPAKPAPPDVPQPAPGEPMPIPRKNPMSLMILAPGDGPGEQPHASPTSRPTRPSSIRKPSSPSTPPLKLSADGNAIYRIDPGGFVTEIFRQPVSVFSILEQSGVLLVATGSEGSVYQVNPEMEETLVLAKVDPKDVLCLLPAKDGRIFMGLGNAGEIATMSSGFSADGVYTSAVLDAGQISRFGKIQLRGTLPANTTLKIATRSGNVEESNDSGWSKWSDDIIAAEFVQSPSPAARFLQYRLTFASAGGAATPVVEEVNVAYQVPNQAPQVKSVKIDEPSADEEEAEPHQGSGKLTIDWMSSDPNEDELQYALYFRSSGRGPWILLKDKLKDQTFDWETRGVGDGRYEIRVEASDASANPAGQGKTASRVSDPIVVDNTAPQIGDIKSSVTGIEAKISLNVADRTGTVARLQYSVDSSDKWQTVLPSDSIADSPQEAYEFVVGELSPGPHQITLRAADDKGNRAFESISVTIAKN